jgi:diketogulonate reductase-like aldo/keto reductase
MNDLPSSGEPIPAIGMGTWDTFDVGTSRSARVQLREVLRIFFEKGGRLIDSSPMYASSERVLGELLSEINPPPPVFSATKVWIRGQRAGIRQMDESLALWRIPRFDLMQIHNLLDWEKHLETLKEWKAAGRIRYIGITTSHGSRHAEMERIMLREPIDFVQLTYNLVDRSAEDRLLPLAQEKGIAVIANRPFDGGNLFRRVRGKSLPPLAAEFDCATWAQFFLKFVVSHPAITCAIPATRRPEHMADYMGAMSGRMPGAVMRGRMTSEV